MQAVKQAIMQQQSDRTVYVGNVGKEVDEAALMALFGHCGTVRASACAIYAVRLHAPPQALTSLQSAHCR